MTWLPSVLAEGNVTIKGSVGKNKKKYWKPSTMSYFVDIRDVDNIEYFQRNKSFHQLRLLLCLFSLTFLVKLHVFFYFY